MAKDLVYYFTKDRFTRTELGEIQTSFSSAFSIDGDKDSAKVEIYGYVRNAIEPNTIIYHPKTNTWWIVNHDQVDRFPNESGWLYKHTLTLDGAIELLNARDLTDCGFYQNYYTFGNFIQRLFRLSSCEFELQINYDRVSSNQKVNYIKSYENYTLLNALRDFLDGYNLTPKIYFTTEVNEVKWGDNLVHIAKLVLNIIPKTGSPTIGVYDLDTNSPFNDVVEKRNIDKNSNATIVVSNANNVVSTVAKTYPTCGTAQLVDSNETVSPTTARINLPSNIFKVNWLIVGYGVQYTLVVQSFSFSFYYYYGNTKYNEKAYNDLVDCAYSGSLSLTNAERSALKDKLLEIKPQVFEVLEKASRFTLYNCDRWNDYDKNFVKPKGVPDIFYSTIKKTVDVGQTNYLGKLVLCPKDIKDILPTAQKSFGSIGWERGKNYIEDFGCLSPTNQLDKTSITSYEYSDLHDSYYDDNDLYSFTPDSGNYGFRIYLKKEPSSSSNERVSLRISNTSFIVNYIPMMDIKLKTDNKIVGNDSQLYNQNGKLNDSNALSKMLLSHSKELENETITKRGVYYDFTNVPKVGSICNELGTRYVISNVSCSFEQNETALQNNFGYQISAEFTLAKAITTKSTNVSPNTNVRDYGIPQTYNVKRKQLYRDFYEMSYTQESIDTDYYLPIEKILNLSPHYQPYNSHVAVMRIDYDNTYGGDPDNNVSPKATWYYQLDATCFVMKKSIYEVVDFKDNNIIGYSVLNVSSGFDITKLLSGMQSMANTPVSYVDDNGRFQAVQLAFCTNEQITTIYEKYIEENSITSERSIYNANVFIDERIFEGSDSANTHTDYDLPFTKTGTNATGFTKTVEIDITDQMNEVGYTGVASGIEVLGDSIFFGAYGGTIASRTYRKEDGRYYITIIATTLGNNQTTYTYRATGVRVQGYKGAKDNNDFKINEFAYEKDAIEVPVFEYSCQIDDTDEVIIGENILDTKESNVCYIYRAVATSKDYVDNNTWVNTFNNPNIRVLPNEDTGNIDYDKPESNGYWLLTPAVKFRIEGNNLIVSLHDGMEIDSNGVVSYGNKYDISTFASWALSDLSIARYTIDKVDDIGNTHSVIGSYKSDLMFVFRNMTNANIVDGELIIKINYYKTK